LQGIDLIRSFYPMHANCAAHFGRALRDRGEAQKQVPRTRAPWRS